jgi:hypothetical protein
MLQRWCENPEEVVAGKAKENVFGTLPLPPSSSPSSFSSLSLLPALSSDVNQLDFTIYQLPSQAQDSGVDKGHFNYS